MTYTATQALAELDKFPAFKADLIRLLEYGRELAQDPTDYTLIGKIGGRAAALGAALELRDAQCSHCYGSKKDTSFYGEGPTPPCPVCAGIE